MKLSERAVTGAISMQSSLACVVLLERIEIIAVARSYLLSIFAFRTLAARYEQLLVNLYRGLNGIVDSRETHVKDARACFKYFNDLRIYCLYKYTYSVRRNGIGHNLREQKYPRCNGRVVKRH